MIFCFNDSYKFKPLELNTKMLEGAEALKKPPAKDPTVPEDFEFKIEKRLQKRQTGKPQDDEKPPNFKSRPVPIKILEGVIVSLDSGMQSYLQVSFFLMCDCPMSCGHQGVPEKKVLPPTVPESPALALKKRVHREPEVEVKTLL